MMIVAFFTHKSRRGEGLVDIPKPLEQREATPQCNMNHELSTMGSASGLFIVDGRNPANQLRLVVYPFIYKVLCIPGGENLPHDF